MSDTTQFLISLFHTPSPAAQEIFHQVVRAGWLKAAPDYRIERKSSPGHDLLFCLEGIGFVMIRGQMHSVTAGQAVWINGYHAHAHWPDPTHPWELYWLRMNAPWLDATVRILSVNQRPVFPGVDRRRLTRIFKQVFDFMARRPPALEALVHAEAARLVACLFEARQSQPDAVSQGVSEVPVEMREVFAQMSLYPHRPWRLAQLARLARLSVPHFCRRFRQVFHAAPIDWLRRERITHAKHRLLESRDSIKEVAEEVGYNDAFYFSRDFKRYTGRSPSDYRRHAF